MNGKRTLADFTKKRGVIQELDPRIARLAIQEYQDELSSAQRADDAFYRQFSCPSCGCTAMTKEFMTGASGQGVTWVEGEVTPQALLRCTQCQLLMNPRSGMIVETGGHAPALPSEQELYPGVYRSEP